MADQLRFESAISVGNTADASGGNNGLRLADESATTKTIIRAEPGSAVAAQLGVDFAASRLVDDVRVCGLRPGEWMVLGASAPAMAFVDTLDRSGHVSVVDHTHARALIRLTGAEAAKLLEKVCSLDWSDTMTPDGAVVSGSVAKVTCDLIRADVGGVSSYLLSVDRSFGQYLFDALLDAGEEFGRAADAEVSG